ncbi:hypothetical protein [Dongshaea marina]|uniref:hypothetical protein n=1 Tax=Dongshaea marina TaxID=2047966 RepID=UPI000D3E75B8|nr:hypothetical protein [Dongshaea marina]
MAYKPAQQTEMRVIRVPTSLVMRHKRLCYEKHMNLPLGEFMIEAALFLLEDIEQHYGISYETEQDPEQESESEQADTADP